MHSSISINSKFTDPDLGRKLYWWLSLWITVLARRNDAFKSYEQSTSSSAIPDEVIYDHFLDSKIWSVNFSAVLRWALWEQYPWNDLNSKYPAEVIKQTFQVAFDLILIFLQFVFEAADYRMMYSLETASDDMVLYQNVAFQFK